MTPVTWHSGRGYGTLAPSGPLSPERTAPGDRSFPGRVTMIARDPSGMLDMREAATLAGVSVRTIRSWREKGYLARQGIGDRGQPLFTAEAVRAAEQLARAKGIQASGIDPRLLRQRPAA